MSIKKTCAPILLNTTGDRSCCLFFQTPMRIYADTRGQDIAQTANTIIGISKFSRCFTRRNIPMGNNVPDKYIIIDNIW